MQVASATEKGPIGPAKVNVMFDSGSNRSYISKSLVSKLGMKPTHCINHRYNVFGGKSTISLQNVCEFDLSCIDRTHTQLSAIEVPKICAPMYRPEVPKEVLRSLKGLPLALGDCEGGLIEVDILVGLDHYWDIVLNEVVRDPGFTHLVAQNTLIGYILSGWINGPGSITAHQLFVHNDISDSVVRKMWDLESIGIWADEKRSELVGPVLSDFNQSVEFVDGRYKVGLPWKEDLKPQLMSNEQGALVRLNRLNWKLNKDPSLKERYDKALKEMEDSDVIEEVMESSEPAGPVFYLPHRPVIKESSSSTICSSPVFNGSAKAENGISLNDCLFSGPSLNPYIVDVLIRFRRWPYALTADVSKAFLQISLKDEDKDAHRFFWKSDGRTRVMRFKRVTFGIKSSPFLLNATIQYHLKNRASTRVVPELLENLYVDDLLSGANSTKEICTVRLIASCQRLV